MATIQELLQLGKEKLDNSGNEYSKYERKVLLEEVLGCNYMYMLTNPEEEVSSDKQAHYLDYIKKRCEHYPLQYLLGYAHFMDYTFLVNENVLIPRNDTEILVELVNEILNKKEGEKVSLLDLCCGSGCIGISLKLYHKDILLTLSDVSKEALEVTRKNLEKHNVTANVVCGNLFSGISSKMDMIVCNPPYIEKDVINTLSIEVKEYEPHLALDGGIDGLDFYRQITKDSLNHLNKQGFLFFEIGYNQGSAVKHLMEENGFFDVFIKKDYAGLDRVVYGHL